MATTSRPPPQLLCIDPGCVKEIWPHAAPLLREALRRTGLGRFGDIEASVLSGDALLWIVWSGAAIEAAVTTALAIGDKGLVCELTACGGKGRERWLALLAEIEAYARREGCIAMRMLGRKGWARILKDYHVTNIVLERKL